MEKESFVWHKVSEQEKEEIRKKAKTLMDDFSGKLEKIKTKELVFDSGRGLRDEGEPWSTDEDFRNALFSNAPFVEDEQIIAEKGEWKK